LRAPESVPPGIRAVEVADTPGKRYKHQFIASSSKAADAFISSLKENNQMYVTQVVDRDTWYIPFIAPKNKSVTWWLFSTIVIISLTCAALVYLKGLVEDPEFRKNFMEMLKLFKG
jgi:hypothetical protein